MCDILDLRCIFVNELVGSVALTIIFGFILFLIIASKIKLGFDATIFGGFLTLFLLGLAIGNLTVMLAFGGIFAALLVGWIFNAVMANR